MSDDIIDTIAKAVCNDRHRQVKRVIPWHELSERTKNAYRAEGVAALAALRSAGYEVVARPESLPLAALHEAMVAYDAYPSENAEDDYNPCMRVLDAARDFLDAEKAEEK